MQQIQSARAVFFGMCRRKNFARSKKFHPINRLMNESLVLKVALQVAERFFAAGGSNHSSEYRQANSVP